MKATNRKSVLHKMQVRAYKHNIGEKKDPELKCAICGDDRIITVDHIIPTHFVGAFGNDMEQNMEENFQYLCKYHNQIKNARIDAKDPRTYSIMRKILDEAEKYHFGT